MLPASANSRSEFRLLVDAIQCDDLASARAAYTRLDVVSAGALIRIGMLLQLGDLAAARRALDALEDRAQEALRQARAKQSSRTAFGHPGPEGAIR